MLRSRSVQIHHKKPIISRRQRRGFGSSDHSANSIHQRGHLQQSQRCSKGLVGMLRPRSIQIHHKKPNQFMEK